GAIWFSIHDKLALPAVVDPSQPGGVGILQPNPTDETDVNYRTLWDFYEIDYEELPVPVIFADATAVTQFNLPLYGFLSTPDSTSGFNSGLFQPRRFILEQAQARFNAQPLSSEWNKLFILGQPSFSDSNITRLVSTGKGIAAGAGSPALFDKDYLDNKSTYGFSFIEDIWSGTTSFYRTNTLFIKVPDTVGSSELYTGLIELDNSITFTSTPSGHIVLFPAPTGPAAVPKDTTTFLIFSGLPLFSSETFPDDGTQLSKLFGEAIIPGFVPSTEVISDPNVEATKPIFYTNNPNLNDNPNVTGAWYDVYSGALHALGNIYTYAFDDAKALWPEVQIFATDTNVHPNDPNDPTYMGITLGPLTY
ncbi:MAG: hypothetical protein KAR79_03905, partial [Simkaniaceae bacterium]|nr:hypothetical protein [Simkaniaceae bacterium]